MHRDRTLLLQLVISVVLLSAILASGTWATQVPDWLTASEISSAMSLPDGSHVSLRLEEIVKIKASPAYIVIAEPFSRKDRLIVLTFPNEALRLGQSVDISGDLVTLRPGVRALQNVTVWGYESESGELLLHPPIIKCMPETTPWQWKVDLTARDSMSSISPTLSISSDEPNSDSAEGPSYYPRIGNTVDSGSPQTQGVRTQSFYDGIPDLAGLPAGSLVELQCKRIIGVGTETINSTTYKYLDMADDLPSTDWIRCYYSAGLPTGDDRINKITGQIRYTNNGATEVICVDDGPDYNPQTLEGKLDLVSPNTLAFIRTQANGASASLTGKVVTANQTDFPGALYVQEPSDSGYFGGMRVRYSGGTIARGSLVSVTGTVALANDGEREIGATGVTSTGSATIPNCLGMPNRVLGGGDFNAYTPGVNCPTGSGIGLHNKGLLVRSWGRVTASDSGDRFFYLDDGTGFNDGSGNMGVKVSWDWSTGIKPSIAPPVPGWYIAVTGISGSEKRSNGDIIRVLRPRDQADITIHAEDTPPVVTISSPTGTDWHKASNSSASHIVISGSATDAGTGVALVQFGFGPTGVDDPPVSWYDASYNPSTCVWSYDWLTPQTGRVWFRAVDHLNNESKIHLDVTVSSVTVVYVDSRMQSSGDGLSWLTAKKTVNDGMTAATGTADVWVAKGSYPEPSTVTLKSNVGLYGGFVGGASGETVREQRDWKKNTTTLDGRTYQTVVTGPVGVDSSARVDGFTITNGFGTYDGSTYGAGIYCKGSPTIINNTITKNYMNAYSYGYGAAIACRAGSAAIICNNLITENTVRSGGMNVVGGIYCDSSPITITGNTITANDSLGIWCSSSSATISANLLTGNGGGGVQCSGTSTISVSNNRVICNNGFGIFCGGTGTLANNIVIGNSGNGIQCGATSAPAITNNTITANKGRGIDLYYCYPTISNNILAFNGTGIYRSLGIPVLYNNCVYNPNGTNYAGLSDQEHATDISSDPKFIAPEYGRVGIQRGSPCIDAGKNDASGMPTTDIDGEPRKQDGDGNGTVVVDIGADESDGALHTGEPVIVRVTQWGNDSNDGSSWTLSKRTVQAGIDAVTKLGGEVWVASGTYSEKLRLWPYAYVYGGFSGINEDIRNERNWTANKTTLDATALNGSVITARGVMNCCVDGFTIRKGTSVKGGGVYCSYGSPVIAHNSFEENRASGSPSNGAGICFDSSSSPTITNNVFKLNVASNRGGAIYCENSSGRVANNGMISNTAYQGGAMYCYQSTVEVTNNTLAYNTLSGGTACGGICLDYSNAKVSNTIVAFNGGSGIKLVSSPSAVLQNNDVWQQSPLYDGISNQTGLNGNISLDPLLATDHIHISTSPTGDDCKDRGLNSMVKDGDLDIDDEARCSDGVVDIGADEIAGCVRYILTVTVDKRWVHVGESAKVTVNVYDPATRSYVSNFRVDLTVDAGEIVSVTRGNDTITLPSDTTATYGTTDSNGNVVAYVSRDTEGPVNVTATIETCDAPVSKTTRIVFGDTAPVELVFIIDVTGSTSNGAEIKNGINATVDYLAAQLLTQGREFQVAGIKFSDSYPVNPALDNNRAVLYDYTTDTTAFKSWVSQDGPGGGTEYQLDVLMFAKDMAPNASPGLYIALATDEDSDSSLDKTAVANALAASNSIVFIDPATTDLVSYYRPLAVNGGVVEEETGNIGTFTFQHMRTSILSGP